MIWALPSSLSSYPLPLAHGAQATLAFSLLLQNTKLPLTLIGPVPSEWGALHPRCHVDHPLVINTSGLLWPSHWKNSQSHLNISSCFVFVYSLVLLDIFFCICLLVCCFFLIEYKFHESKTLWGSNHLVYGHIPRTWDWVWHIADV